MGSENAAPLKGWLGSPTEIFRTATFRTAAWATAAFGFSTLALFAFIYWQTAGVETEQIDRFVRRESLAIAHQAPANIAADIQSHFASELHRESFAAVFSAQLTPQIGEITVYPVGLAIDNVPHEVTVVRARAEGIAEDRVRVIASRLDDGRILVVGRSIQNIAILRDKMWRALELGVLPALASALAIGLFASSRTLNRVREVNETIERIMQGHLNERIGLNPGGDALDQLATSVNRMLDEIERLVEEIRGVGDDIAHDLRTPLTRLRARLEGARARTGSPEQLLGVIEQAIADLDQSFVMITALLRIGQIEGSARRAGFAPVSLAMIAREVAELYQPLAEAREITLTVAGEEEVWVEGDRDLLFELAANLLDNAVKFTPPLGSVSIRNCRQKEGAVLTISDTGPGIPVAEREMVFKRFYRAERSRHTPGQGLGLSLAGAIARLHGFHVHLADANPGLTMELRGWAAPEPHRRESKANEKERTPFLKKRSKRLL